MTTTEEPTTTAGDGDHPTAWHLSGNRAPVFDEVTITDLEVTGALPPELNGRYVRNGANPQTGVSDHWFLGDGMVHGIELRDGAANWYRNRYVRTPLHANPGGDRMELGYVNMETGGFDFEISTANTHVIGYDGRIFALEEGAFPYELTPQLDTVGPFDFDEKLTTAMTAHPKICGETGELLFFGYSSLPPYLVYHRATPDGRLVQSEEITVGGPTMMHDFVVSRNHTIFMDLPAVFDMELAMSGGMPIRWSDDYPARFGVMPRAGTDADVQWFDVDPCYVFHTLNAHEDGDEVVVRGCRITELWRDSSDIGDPEAEGGDGPFMWEWRFDLASGKVTERQVDDKPSEFPRVPDRLVGSSNRFGYTMAADFDADAGQILKYDFATDSREIHQFESGQTPGEPVFVPAENATSEDDGYLLTYVHDAATDTSHLTVLDATDMSAAPLAQVHTGRRIPLGFHGSWIAD